MGFFDVGLPVRRRMRLRATIPTVTPTAAVRAEIAALPDPGDLNAEERAGLLHGTQVWINQLHAYQTRLAAAADTGGDARLFGAGTTGMLIATLTGQNPAVGSAIVAQAAALTALPKVAAAFTAGQISARHVGLLADAAQKLPDLPADDEQALLDIAALVEPGGLKPVIDTLIGQHQPDTLDDTHNRLRERRGLSLSRLDNGMYRIAGHLDPIAGTRLNDLLSTHMARTETGDPRTPAQRRADALDHIVSNAAASSHPHNVTGISVLVDAHQLATRTGARLTDGTPIGPRTFAQLTCTGIVHVILGERRENTFIPLAMGRKARRATPAQWAALNARDHGCIRCGRPARYCEAHHIIHWADAGLTDIGNLCLLCPRCHGDHHAGDFDITMIDGIPTCHPTRRRP